MRPGKENAVTRLYATAGAVAIAALLGTTAYMIWQRQANDVFADCRAGNVAGGPIGGAFTLEDEAGRQVTDAEVFAKPALVYFGYASCTDICPLDNARNAEAADLLAQSGQDVTPVFISVDPGRDTPAVMAEYSANLGGKLRGLTGTPDQVKAAANAFGVYYKLPDNPEKDYKVDHTTMTYLMLPKTGFAEVFLRETSAREMADRTACFLKTS